MLNIIFSIPIHQRLEVVLDQICNIQHFNPNCGIVFHLSQGFDYKTSLVSKDEFIEQAKRLGNVFINPESVRTGFADIIQAHMSNFEYISKVCDFRYFAICASNESFVRPGLYQYISQYDCGYEQRYITKEDNWYDGAVYKDDDLMRYMKKNGFSKIDITHPEGEYFKKEIFNKIVESVKSFYDYKQMKLVYPREEIYFSTVACNLLPNAKVGEVFAYSAYHKGRLWDVTRPEIVRIIKSMSPLYSVKRVDRTLNDNIRIYLRDRNAYQEKLAGVLPHGIKASDKISNLSTDYASFKKIVNVFVNKVRKIHKEKMT